MDRSQVQGLWKPYLCLWLKITGVISKEDLTGGICYWPPNQDSKAKKAIFGTSQQASNHQTPVLMGDFNHLNIIRTNNSQHIICQVLEMCGEPLPYMCVNCASQEKGTAGFATCKPRKTSFIYILVSNGFVCSDHNIVELGILLSMLKVTSKTNSLDFRRETLSPYSSYKDGNSLFFKKSHGKYGVNGYK